MVLLVLLGHGLLLEGLPLGVGGLTLAQGAAPISVRRIVLPAAAPVVTAEAAPPTPTPTPTPRPEPRAEPPAARVAAPVVPAEPAVRSEEAASAPLASASPPEASASAGALAEAPPADPGPASAPAVAGGEVPVYATRMPAAATLQYDLRRGAIGGQGTLEWRPGPEGYELSIEGSVFGISVLSWRSRGAFDSAGLAPDRFVDSRRGRDVRAANFQRDARKISFSGTDIEYPLVAGAQDRLSWMLQLAAVLEAEPARRAAGEKVSMFVAGARGDGDVWTFTVQGVETLDLAGTALPGTLSLRREPRKAYDTQVEVWLDPGRQHLPVRMRLTTLPSGDSTELQLRP